MSTTKAKPLYVRPEDLHSHTEHCDRGETDKTCYRVYDARDYYALRRECDDLRRDAERYHWLFRQSVESPIAVYRINPQQLGEDQFELLCGMDLEEAIDSAIAAAGEQP